MTPSRRAFLALAVAATGGAAWAAHSVAAVGKTAAFDQRAFETALAAGKPILVEISAPWCSVCRTQQKVLADLFGEQRFAGIVALDVDFDSQGDVVRAFRAQRQSTLIVFADGQEVARSVGDSSRAGIAALLETAL